MNACRPATSTHSDESQIRSPASAQSRYARQAFTFAEVLIALVIVSIALGTLLKLHLMSIRMADAAQLTTEASLLAEEKMAELLAAGFPQPQRKSGAEHRRSISFNWRAEVVDAPPLLPDSKTLEDLRKVSVTVGYRDGSTEKRLEMSTYTANR